MKDNSLPLIFINQESGYLMIDIVNTYVEANYNCILITGQIVERSNPLHPCVRVEKIKKYNRKSQISRIFTWIFATLQVLWLIKTKYRRNHIFIVSNPPIITLIPLFLKNRFSYLIFDVFPEALLAQGYLSNQSFLIRFWRKANKENFKRAERIFTISNGVKEVLQGYAGLKEVELVHLWGDNTFLKPIDPSTNSFIKKNNLENKFIVLYSGGLGITSKIDLLVDIAADCNRTDVIFVIIGDGPQKEVIQQKIVDYNIKNILLLPRQPITELNYTHASAKLSVVVIGSKVSKFAFPSKLFSYLSVGSPILCLAPDDADASRFVLDNKVGVSFNLSSKSDALNFIVSLADDQDKWKQLSNNSLKLSKLFTSENAKKFL